MATAAPTTAPLASRIGAALMLRHTVQFHWHNAGYRDIEDFLAALSHDKRKKIRQERRKVEQAGVRFRWAIGTGISAADWDFFYRCYERTYLEHGNAPYLTRDFFGRMARDLPQAWLMFIAERGEAPIASSLIGLSDKLPLRDAVLMNGALVHGLDYDDTHPGGPVHPSSSAFPCTLGRFWV